MLSAYFLAAQMLQPSSLRSYLYKQPPAQPVSLLDFPTQFWIAAWHLFHAQFCSSGSVNPGTGFPPLLLCTAASSTQFLNSPQADLPCSTAFALTVCFPMNLSTLLPRGQTTQQREIFGDLFLLTPSFCFSLISKPLFEAAVLLLLGIIWLSPFTL